MFNRKQRWNWCSSVSKEIAFQYLKMSLEIIDDDFVGTTFSINISRDDFSFSPIYYPVASKNIMNTCRNLEKLFEKTRSPC